MKPETFWICHFCETANFREHEGLDECTRCGSHSKTFFSSFPPDSQRLVVSWQRDPKDLKYLGNSFAGGVISMARHCLSAIENVRGGHGWTLDDMERWLNACITNDPAYLAEVLPQIAAKSQIVNPKS